MKQKIKQPLIIDVEASGFGHNSYPIEVGVALPDGEKFCTLILPVEDWTHWDEEAEKTHRIKRDVLEQAGKPVTQVADMLNNKLAGKTLYTDGWVVDKPWLTKLFYAAGRQMLFNVSPLELILKEEQMEKWHEAKDKLSEELGINRHRASHDAWLIQKTYMETLP